MKTNYVSIIIHFFTLQDTRKTFNIAVYKYSIIYIGLDAFNFIYICVYIYMNSYNKLMTRKCTI